MQVLNKNTQILFNDKPNLGKRATEDKIIKAEHFIEIAKSLKILRVSANFKKSIDEHPWRWWYL